MWCILIAEICGMSIILTQVSIIRRSGTEFNVRAQIITTFFAEIAPSAWYSRLNGNSVPYKNYNNYY
jgi:hypothetical protein